MQYTNLDTNGDSKNIWIYVWLVFLTSLTFWIYLASNHTDIGSDFRLVGSDGPARSNNRDAVRIIVKSGDTLAKILSSQHISHRAIDNLVKNLKKQDIKLSLQPGQTVSFLYNDLLSDDNEQVGLNSNLEKIIISVNPERNIVIHNTEDGLIPRAILSELKKKYIVHDIKIKGSISDSLRKFSIGTSNIQNMINAYSNQIDLKRQIKSGDSIKIMMEKFYNENGEFVQNGKILYSSLIASGRNYDIYLYKQSSSSNYQYYSDAGKSVKLSFLTIPVSKGRITSKFGIRKHPVLGFKQMHKGVDFAAPVGTPIKAAADGVVKYMGYNGSYGNMIKLSHNSSAITVYAHASKFAPKISVGSRVIKGQVIAYVGRSGRATGAHCHYELIVNGKHVNPISNHVAPGQEIKREEMAKFEYNKRNIQKLVNTLQENTPHELAILL
ncbi:MAG: M23 family metallopeptidase [Rickettsiaceae bacterium]|nr:M23 family metallopeptidase [Rickettsiaceae bacterium]